MLLSDAEIGNVLADYGVVANARQCEQIRAYIALLLKWNRSVSLTTVEDESEILRFHFGESAFALSAIDGIHGRLADVGAGAGFPGLPLRIFSERVELILIESNSKKCAFLHEAVRALCLPEVRILRSRFEEQLEPLRASIDVVVARALGGYDELLEWTSDVLTTSGKVVLWVGDEGARQLETIGGWRWSSRITIPRSRQRFLLVGWPLHVVSR